MQFRPLVAIFHPRGAMSQSATISISLRFQHTGLDFVSLLEISLALNFNVQLHNTKRFNSLSACEREMAGIKGQKQ